MDLWVVRNNHMMPYLYWGFEQLADEEVVRVLEKAKAVLFLSDFKPLTRGINRKAEVMVTRFVQEWFSSARDEQLHQVRQPHCQSKTLVLNSFTYDPCKSCQHL